MSDTRLFLDGSCPTDRQLMLLAAAELVGKGATAYDLMHDIAEGKVTTTQFVDTVNALRDRTIH